ncbi:MAG TPA: type II secretion system minor pseudopilin GspH [Gammaproteobacteria bacterium]|nr:type II secretion system minor pseudopilin GspH [Gammaproteobacteria bacterium]
MSPRLRTRGFTLIELLVVLVIIGIVVSIAVVSLNALGRNPPAEKAAQQIADLAGLAAEQAVMQGQEYGLRIEPHAFEFYVYDGRNWTATRGDDLFKRHELGDDVTLSLVLEGTPVKLAPPPSTANQGAPASTTAASTSTSASSDDANRPLPQVLLLSSGELPPFEIDVSGSGDTKAYIIKGTLADGIHMVAPGDAAVQE